MTRLALLAATLAALPLGAQQPTTQPTRTDPAPHVMPGYSPSAALRQRNLESDAIRRPSAATARAHARALTREAHVAGTPAQARTRDYVVDQMRRWGIETEVRTYEVWLPHPTSVRIWRVSPSPTELPLAEPPVPGDSQSALPQYPTVNGYSGVGDVTGEVVYVNYGLIEDYAQLDSIGVSVRGRVVVARYGRSFRGIKAREAERHGAAALLIYSDPQDDGYVRGDVYPDGPMRPPRGVQRGSVMNGAGDPSTPGYASVRGAPRLDAQRMPVPRIPVVPIAYANAAELLRDLRGKDVPQTWQGGLPFRYHVGPGPVRARVAVTDDRATRGFKEIYNTLGVIRGSEFPDELVVIGAHRDAWNAGAVDNVSGTVSVLEAARAVAEQVRDGRRPKRTIVFATWDAEEWGLIGSTEHVEDDSLRLMRGGVAYLNQDVAASGSRFGGGGSPSLRSILRDVARRVADPSGRGSVYDEWRRTAGVADTAEPSMGDPGGGSDFAGFYNHLGIPHSDWGFGGPGGVYHSHYDTYHWMSTFGDTGFVYHATAGRIAALMTLRLANADILPYDYVEFARTMRRYVVPVQRAIDDRRWGTPDAIPRLALAINRMEQAATGFAAARDSALASVEATGRELPRANRERTNAALRDVERELTRPEGLRTRPWYRSLIYVADENDGYANMVFPSINEAIRAGDPELMARETEDLIQRFDAATRALVKAREGLRSQ
ncbi:MAG: M20/M25/M40 family metallo-hydrolase [Gemmatimonadaceae bacterium]